MVFILPDLRDENDLGRCLWYSSLGLGILTRQSLGPGVRIFPRVLVFALPAEKSNSCTHGLFQCLPCSFGGPALEVLPRDPRKSLLQLLLQVFSLQSFALQQRGQNPSNLILRLVRSSTSKSAGIDVKLDPPAGRRLGCGGNARHHIQWSHLLPIQDQPHVVGIHPRVNGMYQLRHGLCSLQWSFEVTQTKTDPNSFRHEAVHVLDRGLIFHLSQCWPPAKILHVNPRNF